jgi:hypothetical protein
MNEQKQELQDIGKSAYNAIAEMVAALDCDYDRLEELREERDNYTIDEDEDEEAPDGPGYANDAEAWAGENADDAEELKALEEAAGECESREDAIERIMEDPLSLRIFGERVNGEWEADRFEILLSTGGPATRIMGELDSNNEPCHAYLEAQDWGTQWTEYFGGERDTLLAYCRCFCFE